MEEKTEHEHKKVKVSKKRVWQVSTIVLAVLLIISVVFNVKTMIPDMSAKDAGEKTISYLNTNVLQGVEAKLLSVEKASDNLYNIKLDVGGKQYDSYVTADGKLLFPQALSLEEQVEVPEEQQPEQTETPKTEKPNVKMFVMSFCPYGQQAEIGLGPAIKALGADKIDFEPHFVVYSNYRGGGPQFCMDAESKYCSMHGVQEMREDARQLCVWKYDKAKFWDYVNEINAKCSSSDVDTCWENVAKDKGVNVDKIKTCFEKEAITLLKAELELNQKFSVQGSPTVLINDVSYNGGRSADAYKQGICNAFTTPPDECGEALEGEAAAATGSC